MSGISEKMSAQDKDEVSRMGIEGAAKILIVAMEILGAENYITGKVEHEGQFYDLTFVRRRGENEKKIDD